MKEAIKKAEEGGYCILDPMSRGDILISKNFWYSLGKALGWGKIDEYAGTDHEKWVEEWTVKWHDFIDWLIEGKSADEFFRSLIK